MDYVGENIVFYDGECGFCNRTVQFILKYEKEHKIYFSPIQSAFARDFFDKNKAPQPDLSTFYFYTNNILLTKSTGALALLKFLKWPFFILNLGRVIPVCQRDQLYDFIAKRRKKISRGFCLVPTKDQSHRFIN